MLLLYVVANVATYMYEEPEKSMGYILYVYTKTLHLFLKCSGPWIVADMYIKADMAVNILKK